jgi:hypothetical protein
VQADISEITRFLDRFAPAALLDLRQRYPDAAPYFDPSGLPLGADANVAPSVAGARTLLDQIDGVASTAVSETRTKLKLARRLELGGSVLSLAASGGVVGAVNLDKANYAAVFGGIAGAASLAQLITAWLRRAAIGQESIDQLFVKLRELLWDAQSLRAEFSRDPDESNAPGLIKRTNDLAKASNIVLSDLGYDPKFRPV